MRHSFRIALLGILGIATLAFTILVVHGLHLEHRASQELTRIGSSHVPRIEIGLRLMAGFDALVHAMSDAVAARDEQALEATRTVRDALLSELDGAHGVLDRSDSVTARTALRSYYTTAMLLSQRSIASADVEAGPPALSEVQRKQRLASEALREATAFDPADLTRAFASASAAQQTASRSRLIVSITCLLLVLCCSLWLSRRVLRALREIGAGFTRFGRGEFDAPIAVLGNDEFGALAAQANQMAASLKELNAQRERSNWLTGGSHGLLREMRGELEPEAVAQCACRYLARFLGAPAAAVYWADDHGVLHLLGQHGACMEGDDALPKSIRRGGGLVSQSANEQDITVLEDVPAGYFHLCSGLGDGLPRVLVLVPLVRGDQVVGVLELALFGAWGDDTRDLLLSVREPIAVAVEVELARRALRELLEESQQQAELLRRQEDALRSNNQALQKQQDELLGANTELHRQAAELEAHRHSLERKNAELLRTRRTLERKAQELTTVSAYKSQFLATMSHELRTPLNSMLILSSLLAEHQAGVLTERQTEYSRTIHASATDLLALINQVLDLAKVEAGKQDIRPTLLPLGELVDYARRMFEPLARDKGLDFEITLDVEQLPEAIVSDRLKVEQILNNLLGNAIKFTESGHISLSIAAPAANAAFERATLGRDELIAISVHDTGSGIAPHDRERVFDAFEQVDGGTDRRHQGSGLGLSIARELAALLGGELRLADSAVGRGSTFVCYLPRSSVGASAAATLARASAAPPRASMVMPPRASMVAPRRSMRAPRALSAAVGPASAELGTPRRPRVLVVEDEPGIADLLTFQLNEVGIDALTVGDGASAMQRLARESFSCIVLDLGLPDRDGLELLEEMSAKHPAGLAPVLVYTGRALSDAQLAWLEQQTEVVVIKEGLAIERVVDEVRLLLARLEDGVTRRPGKSAVVPAERIPLQGRKLLVVDDDMRNVYALSALLGDKGADLLFAENGRHALETMHAHPDVELVLMDMMMPEVDGYEATRTLRRDPRFAAVPIIALTAKAMKNDRERCLLAGATDYLAKPLDPALLFAMIGALLTEPMASEPARRSGRDRGRATR